MPPLHLKYLPIFEIAIALLLVLLPISNSNILINGIQTAKSFNFYKQHFSGKVVKVYFTFSVYQRNDKFFISQELKKIWLYATVINEFICHFYNVIRFSLSEREQVFLIDNGPIYKKNVSNTIGICL